MKSDKFSTLLTSSKSLSRSFSCCSIDLVSLPKSNKAFAYLNAASIVKEESVPNLISPTTSQINLITHNRLVNKRLARPQRRDIRAITSMQVQYLKKRDYFPHVRKTNLSTYDQKSYSIFYYHTESDHWVMVLV